MKMSEAQRGTLGEGEEAATYSRGLLSVHSGYNLQTRLMRPFPPEASAAWLPPPLLRLLPGEAIQFPGEPFIPLWTSAFHGAL